MNKRYHHSEENATPYRTVARKADGRYVVVAYWSAFEKALGCCFGFYASEKFLYHSKKAESNPGEANKKPGSASKYFSIFVQRRDPKAGFHDWTTVPQSLLRLDFDTIVREEQAPLKSGDLCNAMLLARKTRHGGWIARVADTNCEGPITNTDDVPTDLRPGATVKLKIGAVDKEGNHIQFTWTNAQAK